MRNLANIIADLEAQRATVADLEKTLAAARVRGNELLKEFSHAQGSLHAAFGNSSGPASKLTRKPREASANYWTSATRAINNSIAAQMSPKEILAAAKAAVAKLADKNASPAPEEVLAGLDARVKELYALKSGKTKGARK